MNQPLLRSISVRQLFVDPAVGFPRHWNDRDPYKSHLYNSLSMLFPRGEQYLLELVRDFVPQLRQAQQAVLLDEAQSFIGQEATHRRMHEQFNSVLAAQGYSNKLEAIYEARIRAFRRYSPLTQLALAAAYEHITTAVSDGHLRNAGWAGGMVEPLKTMWDWHAVEESEHKSVVFDVYRWAGGGYWRRVACSAWVDLLVVGDLLRQTVELLRHDRLLFARRSWASALGLWFGREGMAWHLLPRMAQYFMPRFHPWQHDNAQMIDAWKQQHSSQFRVLRSSAPVRAAVSAAH